MHKVNPEIPALADPDMNFDLEVATKLGYFEKAIQEHSQQIGSMQMELGGLKERVQNFREEVFASFNHLNVEVAKVQNPSISLKTIAKIALPIMTGSSFLYWLLTHLFGG